MAIRLGIVGLNGRMGKRIAEVARGDFEVVLVGGGGRNFSWESLVKEVDVLIDFSSPEALSAYLPFMQKEGKALVVGTTGLSSKDYELLQKASQKIPLLYSPNFSLGMALLKRFSREASRLLSSKKPCIAIVETHHREKKDAPSGSALALAEGMRPHAKETISIHSLRTAKVIGEHTVHFHLDEEKIELKHEALSRDTFAKGAISSAKYLAGKAPGFYTFEDVVSSL